MKTEGFFTDYVDECVVRRIDEAITANIKNFNELTRALGLNPSWDFRYADLSNVDFSSSDLRGHNFTGANLTGSFGIAVDWDLTTILDSASLSNSLFQSEIMDQQLFKSDQKADKEYKLLSKQYWMDQILRIGENLAADKDSKYKAFARRLVRESDSRVIRSSTLIALQSVFSETEQNFSFLVGLLSKKDVDSSTVRWVLQLMSDLFIQVRTSADIMVSFTDFNHRDVRLQAYNGILNSPYLKEYTAQLLTSIGSESDSGIRKIFLDIIVIRFYPSYSCIVSDRDRIVSHPKRTLDFRDPISRETIRDISTRLFYKSKSNVGRIEDLENLLFEALVELKNFGIPFEFVDLKTPRPSWA